MSESRDKVTFGQLKATNPNWVKLKSELMVWRKDNMESDWPSPQNFCSICPTWGQFRVSEFHYRYNEAKLHVDRDLNLIPRENGKLFYIFIHNLLNQLTHLINLFFSQCSKGDVQNLSLNDNKKAVARINSPNNQLDPDMILQYQLSLYKDVMDSEITNSDAYIEQLLREDVCPEIDSKDKLVFIVHLPIGAKMESYRINSSGDKIMIVCETHKLMWHPRAIHHAIMSQGSEIGDAMDSKNAITRSTRLTEAIKNRKKISSSARSSKKEYTIDLEKRVDRNGKTTVCIRNYSQSASNDMQLAFVYFEMDLIKNTEMPSTPEKIRIDHSKKMKSLGGGTTSSSRSTSRSTSSGPSSHSTSSSRLGSRPHSSSGECARSDLMDIDDKEEEHNANANANEADSGNSRSGKEWKEHIDALRTHYEERMEQSDQQREDAVNQVVNYKDKVKYLKNVSGKVNADLNSAKGELKHYKDMSSKMNAELDNAKGDVHLAKIEANSWKKEAEKISQRQKEDEQNNLAERQEMAEKYKQLLENLDREREIRQSVEARALEMEKQQQEQLALINQEYQKQQEQITIYHRQPKSGEKRRRVEEKGRILVELSSNDMSSNVV